MSDLTSVLKTAHVKIMHFESIENIMFVLFNIFYEFPSYSDPEKYLCFPFLPDNKTSLSESDTGEALHDSKMALHSGAL